MLAAQRTTHAADDHDMRRQVWRAPSDAPSALSTPYATTVRPGRISVDAIAVVVEAIIGWRRAASEVAAPRGMDVPGAEAQTRGVRCC